MKEAGPGTLGLPQAVAPQRRATLIRALAHPRSAFPIVFRQHMGGVLDERVGVFDGGPPLFQGMCQHGLCSSWRMGERPPFDLDVSERAIRRSGSGDHGVRGPQHRTEDSRHRSVRHAQPNTTCAWPLALLILVSFCVPSWQANMPYHHSQANQSSERYTLPLRMRGYPELLPTPHTADEPWGALLVEPSCGSSSRL